MSAEGSIDQMFDFPAVAKLLGVSVRKIWRLVASGELPKPVKVGRAVRFFLSDISQYQQKLKQARDGGAKQP